MKKPTRVLCDFKIAGGSIYFYFGITNHDKPNVNELKTQIGIKKECAKAGLWPLELVSS